ncbi:nucleotidyltransferase domain-containing protein [Paenibacillus abyssi]|uniref:Polymerase nucleotidyl transferase domain-containing protein n=1 Tax=Paenibacillus abyssi TaxID=1340531 RepID=A0A917FX46_9BACL|nr:nucleotidyltransferase domain-containing protein [Paenibacillus abyssi]GGG09788.1 hypothetical protein GCM10010916_28350 [Paenibacillus abyssi]
MISSLENIVKRYVKKYYPGANVVLLAGSAAAGRATKGSDLDVLIFDEHAEDSYRLIDKKYGRIIEVFLVALRHYPYFIEEAKKSGIPSMVRMCAEGVIIIDDGQAHELIANGRKAWAEGPYPRSLDELNQVRYEITEYLDDLIHSSIRSEDLFIFNKISELLIIFILRINNRWLGSGKWAYRALEEYDPGIAAEFVRVSDLFYKAGVKDEFIQFVYQTLAPFGGTLRVGWVEGADVSEDEI